MKSAAAALVFLAFGIAPPAHADDAALAGRWEVRYWDADLGVIEGWAFIDTATGRAEVRYVDPRSGESADAEGPVRQDGDQITITLHGTTISSQGPLTPAGEPVSTGTKDAIELVLGETKAVVPLTTPPPPPAEITLNFSLSKDGIALTGLWRESVDAVGGHDAKRQGRRGELRLLYDGAGGAVMEGVESWSRPEIALADAFALQDQSATLDGRADWPEPFDAQGRPTAPQADRRLLFVVGHDLPGLARELSEITSDDPGITYSVRAYPADTRKGSPGLDPWLTRGWQMLKRSLPADRLAALRPMDVMLVDVTLKPGVQPGAKTLSIEGAQATWLLQFGDWRGRLSLARPIGFGQSEAAAFLYPQEHTKVQILLDREIPLDNIPVIVGVVPASGSPRFGVGGGKTVMAHRDPAEPRRYLSDDIVVSDPVYADTYPAGTMLMQAVPGDRIAVSIGEENVVSLDPPMATALVLASPRHLKAYLTGVSADRGRLWPDVLSAAAACHNIDVSVTTNLDSASADTIENRIVFAWTKMSRDVSVGEHAAAILLRDVFVELLSEQEREFKRSLNDEEILGFRRLMRDAVWREARPLGDLMVSLPDGAQETFAASYLDEMMTQRHGISGDVLRQWQIAATREVRDHYAQAIARSRQIAENIDDCDTEGLLALTGFDFAPVRAVAKELLVTLSEDPLGGASEGRPAWQADRRARAWLERVAYTAQTVAAIRHLSSEDNQQILTAVFIAALPLALFEAPAAMTAMFALDLADTGISAGRMALNAADVHAEAEFATGAAAIIGTRRYDAAAERKYEVVRDLFSVLAAAGGTTLSATQFYEGMVTAAERAAIARGDEVAGTLTVDEVFRLNAADLRAVTQAGLNALSIAATAGEEALSRAQRSLLSVLEAAAVRLERPQWAVSLAPELWQRIRAIGRLPHIKRLFATAAERMSQLAYEDDALALMWRPFGSIDDLEAALAKSRAKTKALGPDFYDQMSPDVGRPAGYAIHDRLFVEENGDASFAIRVTVGKDNAEIADFKRGLVHDKEFGTDGLVLELDYAKIRIRSADDSLRMVQGLDRPLTQKGTPLGLYLNLRAANGLGMRYADPRLTFVKLSHVVNVNTCVQMAYWRRFLGSSEAALKQAAEHTFSVGYAADALEQMGYRVVGVERVARPGRPAEIRAFANMGFFDGADIDTFTAAYGINPDDTVDFGYDIYLRVAPSGQ